MVMSMKSYFIIKMVGLLLASLLFQRCATAYKPVHPDQLVLWDQQWMDPDSTVIIETMKHVLGNDSFNKFVKAEENNRVHMIVLKIQNHGTRDLHLPDDLDICLENGYSIVPLKNTDGMVALTSEMASTYDNSTVDLNEGWLASSWTIGRSAPGMISLLKFNKNMKEYYMETCTVRPGEKVAGILVLPISPNEPFQVCLR